MKNLFSPAKTINHKLASEKSEGGNAYFLLAAFKTHAKWEKWSNDEIDLVMKEAMSSDYNHLRETLKVHCQ